ncbi:YceD family protein [Aquabacterium sp. A7-Y]|uniref:YceD family protein n=1 Tax=Aquabacterium sp. A7-Y TaxID=1349605 RepID=UPI00223DF06F|nr:YceD family protein [Aquabacterium sp. A7-Y]MCW7541794.1 YceD family protein [Aquabacterium sp. A7-Y]
MKAREFNPLRLDVGEFVRAEAELQGEWPLRALQRLAEEAHEDAPAGEQPVRWSVAGRLVPRRGGDPELWMHLKADTSISLECQRCLRPVEEHLGVERDFRFVPDEKAAAEIDADSEEDVLALSRSLNLQDLVEDELILALPLVPRHEVCPESLAGSAGAAAVGSEASEEPAGERRNPFAVLAQLKKDKLS